MFYPPTEGSGMKTSKQRNVRPEGHRQSEVSKTQRKGKDCRIGGHTTARLGCPNTHVFACASERKVAALMLWWSGHSLVFRSIHMAASRASGLQVLTPLCLNLNRNGQGLVSAPSLAILVDADLLACCRSQLCLWPPPCVCVTHPGLSAYVPKARGKQAMSKLAPGCWLQE